MTTLTGITAQFVQLLSLKSLRVIRYLLELAVLPGPRYSYINSPPEMCEAKLSEKTKTKRKKTAYFFIPLFKAIIRLKNTEKRCLFQGIVINRDDLIALRPGLLYLLLPTYPCVRYCVRCVCVIDLANNIAAYFAQKEWLYRVRQ